MYFFPLHLQLNRAYATKPKGYQPPADSKPAIWGAKYIKPSVISSNLIAEPYKGPKKRQPVSSYFTPSGWSERWKRWKDYMKSTYSLSKLKKKMKQWNLKEFKMDALDVYMETCEALACGDINTLRRHTTPPIFSDMKKQLRQRQYGGWKRIEWTLKKKPDLYEMELVQARVIAADPKDDRSAFVQLTVKIPSTQTFAAYDDKGKLVAGNPDEQISVVDHWVFEVPLASDTLKWRVAGRLSIQE